MLIGIDASRANKKWKTGVEWYSYYLIQELKKIDQQNRYFLYSDRPLVGDLARCPQNFFEKILSWPLSRFWTLGRLSLEMLFGKKPDTLFVPAHTLPLVNPKNAVVTVHDIGFERFPSAYSWVDKLYHRVSIRIIKRAARKIITVSEFSKKELQDVYQIPARKIAVVYNGFEPIRNENLELSEELKQKINGPYLFFIGRLEEKKNVARVVEAFAQLRRSDLKLVLAGKPGFGFERIEKIIAKNNLQDRVVILGWTDQQQIPALFANAEVFVFPSLYEGFGIPVLEAMDVKCPVLTSNTSSLPEVAGDAAYLVDPENVQEIVAGLQKILSDQDYRASLVARGLEQVKKFSWEKCARQTLKNITDVI